MTEKIKHYYFGYGMNTDPEQMILRTGQPVAIGRAMVRDHAFRFALHADVYPQAGTDVYGVLWEIDDHALKALDQREGYPYYYDRKQVTVECGGQLYQAWMYFMTAGHPVREPSSSYLAMLVRGYTTFNVPQDQIMVALEQSKQNQDPDTDIDTYKFNRTVIAYQGITDLGHRRRPIRWFDSYTELVKFTHGRRVLKKIAQQAAAEALTLEQLCNEMIYYDELYIPDHFQVRDSNIKIAVY